MPHATMTHMTKENPNNMTYEFTIAQAIERLQTLSKSLPEGTNSIVGIKIMTKDDVLTVAADNRASPSDDEICKILDLWENDLDNDWDFLSQCMQ